MQIARVWSEIHTRAKGPYGVVVLSAPREDECQRLLQQIDRVVFQHGSKMPLQGRKLHVHTDWSGDLEPA